MARKKHLINVHTSTGTTAPTGASLYLGEIAVQHTTNDPALWIKVGSAETSTEYEKFIGRTEIMTLIEDTKILGSGYTYSGLSYVNSATSIADAYSALTSEVIKDEKIISAAFNDLNDRINDISAATQDLHVDMILGSGYTYSGLSYVNSATSIADAYSALTEELFKDEKAISAAFNDLNSRVNELSGNSAVEELAEYVQENEEVVAGALNELNERVGTIETQMTGDYIPLTGYELASGTSEEELTITEEDTVNEAIGKLQKQMLDNEESIAAGLNDLNTRLDNVDEAISHSTGITQLSGAVRSLSAATYNISDGLNELYNNVNNNNYGFAYYSDVQSLSAATHGKINQLSGATQFIGKSTLTINMNGVEQGKYTPLSGNTTINLTAATEVTGADVLLTGYELASGTTEEELAIAATDTVNEAFGKIQKQNYDNEAVIAGSLNDLDERIAVLEANSGSSAGLEELSASVISNRELIGSAVTDMEALSGAVVTKEYVIASALNDLNDRVLELSGNTGGGSVQEIFFAESGITTIDEIMSAISEDKLVVAKDSNNKYYQLNYILTNALGTAANFNRVESDNTVQRLTFGKKGALDVWNVVSTELEKPSNKVTAITTASTDVQYPSAKLVYDKSRETNHNIPYIATDQIGTGSTSRFTASCSTLDELTEGQSIILHLGKSTTTGNSEGVGSACCLNLCLSDGTTTGPQILYYGRDTKLTTHYGSGNDIRLTYHENMTVSAKTGLTGWWAEGNYDANTDVKAHNLFYGNAQRTVTGNTLGRYRLMLSSADENNWVPINTSTATTSGAAKTITSVPIDPFGPIAYYSTTTTIAAGSVPTASYVNTKVSAVTIAYSFVVSLTARKPVFLKCTPQANGSALIDPTTPFVQDFPNTEDGKIYIFLGVAASATIFELYEQHPVYEYKNGHIRLYQEDEIFEAVCGVTTYQEIWDAYNAGKKLVLKIDNSDQAITQAHYAYLTDMFNWWGDGDDAIANFVYFKREGTTSEIDVYHIYSNDSLDTAGTWSMAAYPISTGAGSGAKGVSNSSNSPEIPPVTSSDAGKILSVNSEGKLEWISPVSIYTRSGEPGQDLGNDGDIYLQTS